MLCLQGTAVSKKMKPTHFVKEKKKCVKKCI
jgi:hypothetical protein